MIKSVIAEIIKDRLSEEGYYIKIDVCFSEINNRRIIGIEFDEEIDYSTLVKLLDGFVNEDDISCQDSTGIIIDFTEEILNKIINYATLTCRNEFENMKPKKR